jgi:hypothetical protein
MEKATFTRRSVLGGAAIAATAAIVGEIAVSSSNAATPVTAPQGVAAFREAQFAKLVGQSFRIQIGSSSQTLILSSVTPLAIAHLPQHKTAGGAATTGEQFSLLFTGSPATRFTQGTYSLSSPSLGNFAMFLVPVNIAKTHQTYQAIIVNV